MPSTPIYSAYNNTHFLGIFCRPANPQTNAFSSVLSRLQCRAMCDSWFKHWPPPLPYVAGAGEAHRKLTPVTKKGPNRCFHRRNRFNISTPCHRHRLQCWVVCCKSAKQFDCFLSVISYCREGLQVQNALLAWR